MGRRNGIKEKAVLDQERPLGNSNGLPLRKVGKDLKTSGKMFVGQQGGCTAKRLLQGSSHGGWTSE